MVRLTFNDVEVRVPVLTVQVQNRGVAEVEPQEIRRQHPVLVAARGVRAVHRLVRGREAALGDVVLRVVVDVPRHDGVQARGRLVLAGPAVVPGDARGVRRQLVAGAGRRVVADDAGGHGERLAVVGEAAVARQGGRVEAVAARRWVGAHPVVARGLVCLHDDGVALTWRGDGR